MLVNLHTAVIGQRKPVSLTRDRLGQTRRRRSPTRAGRCARSGSPTAAGVETPIYVRERLPLAARFDGPAIVEQLDCTTVVEPGHRVAVDPIGNLIVSV